MMRYNLFAPAKINLDLRITGVRADGYHTLRSHVAFADCGDDLVIDIENDGFFNGSLDVDGPFADHVKDMEAPDNLAFRAAAYISHYYQIPFSIDIRLTKNLPSGAGMGGGSADAAAVLRGLAHHFKIDDKTAVFKEMCLSLGADVPVCYAGAPCIMEGIGENLSPWNFTDTPAVLIWPGIGGSTKDLYAAYDAHPLHAGDGGNDFQDLATAFCPQITEALNWAKALPGCQKAQLTGSGTAVFALFDRPAELPEIKPFPWVQPCSIGSVNKPLVSPLGAG